jgi:RNA polymerase sigma-70 factor (ECF subfamily)
VTLTSADISSLYDRHAQGILRFAMRRTLDAQLAVDILAETFAVAYEQRKKFRGDLDTQGGSWLFGIASNLLSRYFRSGGIERRALERLGIGETIVPDEQIERIEQLAGSASLRIAVARAMGDLPEAQRRALELRIVEERSYAEVAAALEVTEEVARARVSRGIGVLRTMLEENDEDEVSEYA